MSHSPHDQQDQQYVSDIVVLHLLPDSLMALGCFVSSQNKQDVSDSALFPLQTVSCHDQQNVSDAVFFCKVTHPGLINSMWVTLHFLLCQEIITMTNRGWVTWIFTFARQTHHVSFHDQQYVSDITFFLLPALIMSYPMIISGWVTLHFFCQAVLLYLIHDQQGVSNAQAVSLCLVPWLPTGCEWHCIFILTGSLIVTLSHPMTTRMWVTMHILFCQAAHLFHQQHVSDIAFLLMPDHLVMSDHPITNR